MSNHNLLVVAWIVLITASAATGIINAAKDRALLSRALFLWTWLTFSLAPVYKIFAIGDNLEGSRAGISVPPPHYALCLPQLSHRQDHARGTRTCRATPCQPAPSSRPGGNASRPSHLSPSFHPVSPIIQEQSGLLLDRHSY